MIFFIKLPEPRGFTEIILHQSSKIRIRNAATEAPNRAKSARAAPTTSQPTTTTEQTGEQIKRGEKPTSAANSAARSLTCSGGGRAAAAAVGLDAQHLRRNNPRSSSTSSAGSRPRRASRAKACWPDFLPALDLESWVRERER